MNVESLPGRRVFVTALLSTLGCYSLGVRAQAAYPSRPVTLVVPFSPGGATDILARALAERLQARMGQSFIVDNRAGGNTLIGTKYVASQPADGYTLYFTSSRFSAAPATNPSTAVYDPVNDFTPIARVSSILMAIAVNPKLPVRSMGELIDLAKTKPGGLAVGTASVGGSDHLAAAMLAQRTGAKFNVIPYKGEAPAVHDVVSGVADVRIGAYAGMRQFVESGQLRLLAVGSPSRSPDLPNTPTLSETIPGFSIPQFFGLLGPKGMSADLVRRLNQAIVGVIKESAILTRMRSLGLDPSPSTAAEFAQDLSQDFERTARLLKETGITLE